MIYTSSRVASKTTLVFSSLNRVKELILCFVSKFEAFFVRVRFWLSNILILLLTVPNNYKNINAAIIISGRNANLIQYFLYIFAR